MTAIIFTPRSSNTKTGPIPVTTSDKASCPSDCAFRGNGCYAEQGPLGSIWAGMSKAGENATFPNGRGTISTTDWAGLLRQVRNLLPSQLWRHNQAGDLPHVGGRLDAEKIGLLAMANRGRRGFTYTHHNVLQSSHNRDVVAQANRDGFTVNLSGNNLAHADQLAELSIAPVVVVLPANVAGPAKVTTPAGRKVTVCPATYRDDVTCATCKLCAVAMRETIVGFPAHGARKKAASAVAA